MSTGVKRAVLIAKIYVREAIQAKPQHCASLRHHITFLCYSHNNEEWTHGRVLHGPRAVQQSISRKQQGWEMLLCLTTGPQPSWIHPKAAPAAGALQNLSTTRMRTAVSPCPVSKRW